jgi:nitronate monooxygenase
MASRSSDASTAARDFTARLGIQHALIQAPMAGGPTTPALVAAVSNAGALGSVAAAYLTPQEITATIAATRRLTSRPFAVNLFAGGWESTHGLGGSAPDYSPMLELVGRYHRALGLPAPSLPAAKPSPFEDQLEVVLEAGVRVFSFTFGIPNGPSLERLRDRGVTTMGTATTVAEAKALEAAGVDIIVAQGSEAGAHRGTFLGTFESSMIGTIALVPQIVDALDIPVVASGGIMDGRGIVAAHALGAAGVQMGTAFITCDESGASEAYKAALLAARDDATTVTRAFSGRPARGLVNQFMQDVDSSGIAIPEFPIQNTLTRPMRAAASAAGDTDAFSLWAGQAARLARRGSASALVAALVAESQEIAQRLQLSGPSS